MRTLIQRLNEITRENVLIQNQYTGSIATSLTGALQAESNALISQAVEIAGRIPEYMTSSEYSTLANHLFTKGDNERAGDFYRLAIESAKSPFEEVGALRGYAGFLMSIGNPDEGRKFYQKALDVFNDPSRQVTDISRPYMNAYTEYYWASMELGLLDCSAAQAHYDEAFELADQISNAQLKERTMFEFNQFEYSFEQCQP